MTALVAVVALGIAGFDPLGAIGLVAAVAAGASRRRVALLTAAALVLTTLLGVAMASTLGAALHRWGRHLRHVDHHVWGALTIATGLALAGWGLVRLVPRPRSGAAAADPAAEGADTGRGVSVAALLATASLVALSVLIDPAFYGLVVVAGREPPLLRLLLAAVWTLLSQWLMVLFAVACLTGTFTGVHDALERLRRRWAPVTRTVLSVGLLVVGAAVTGLGIAELVRRWWWFRPGS